MEYKALYLRVFGVPLSLSENRQIYVRVQAVSGLNSIRDATCTPDSMIFRNSPVPRDHELRAPLTSIKGSATAVLGAASALPRAEMLQFFRIIDGQADHMQGLIGNLLEAGRIESGTLSVDPEPSEVAGLVDRARNTFLSGGGRHTIVIDLPPDLPRVMADCERIVQVLNNLLSNAARHSPEASPMVHPHHFDNHYGPRASP